MATDDHGRLEVQVLGPVRAVTDGAEVPIGGPRQQALLGALAVDAGRTVSVDALVDAVWDGSPPDAVDRTFKTYVAKLRRALGRVDGIDPSEVIRTETRGYRFDDAIATVDALRFEEEVARARDHLAGGEPADAELLLRTALGRWRGDVLSGFSDQAWARPEVIRLSELRVVAEESLATAVLDAGRVAEAVALAESLVAAHPERESAVRLLVLALYRTGRHGDALGVARTYRESLAEETGLDPSPQLAALETMVLEQDPRLDRPVGGRRLRGYVLHEVLATTAIGAVHRAEQPSIGRDVAVTVVGAEQADDPDVVRLFEARMQQVAAVEHRRVVPLYDYWRHPGGAYLVTRLPGGGTLSQQLARGRVEPDAALRVLRQVAQGVAAAHERGVVHGALSTDAVVLDEQGHAFVWGFALLPPADGPRGDLEALAGLADELVARVGVGGGEYEADGLAALVAATTAPDDTRVTSVAGFARSLEALLAPDAGTEVVEVTPLTTAPGPNPYRGLASFRETDAEVFFGRDELTRAIVTRLARQPFVAVFGPSGSGKSSVVRAGVLPRLRRDGAYVTAMVPGTAPLAELGVALSRIAAVELADVEESLLDASHGLTGVLGDVLPTAEAEAVLVVDQFEELFTMTPEGERAAFLGVLRDALDHPLRRVRVIATVRADFLGRVLDDPIAGPLVHERSVLARPLTADELHEVVVGPAEVAGVAVEPALATAIVADATRFPGSLPMVQFALTEVFEAADDATMELDAYRRIGGIEGVLGQRAEEVFAGLDGAGQRAAHQLFQRLVVPNDDGPPTRRRAPRAEFAHVPDEVVEAFGRARLLRFDHDEESREPTVEVTHEALFRAWPRLVAWIEEGEDDLRLLGHLTVSAGEWDDGGRREADLYRGHRLDAALAFAADRRDELSGTERAFLDASTARRARDVEADRRSVRRLRLLTGGLAVGLVLALVAGALAVVSQREEAATATAAQADALGFAASATVDSDRELAALLAAEAHAAAEDADSFGALVRVVGDDPRVRSIVPVERGSCATPGGEGAALIVVTRPADDGAVAEVRTAQMDLVTQVVLPGSPGCAVVDPTGTWLVAGDPVDQVLRVVDLATGRVVAERAGWLFSGGPDVSFHPSEPEVVLAESGGRAARLTMPDLDEAAVTEVTTDADFADSDGVVRFGEVGDRVVAEFYRNGPPVVAVVGTDGAVTQLAPPRSPPQGPVALAEQRGLVIATGLSELAIARVEPGAEFETVVTRGTPLSAAQVSPDGSRVAVGTTAGIEVLDLETRQPVGDPVQVDTLEGLLAWSDHDSLRIVLPDAVVSVELDRVAPLGDVLHPGGPADIGTWPAADGSGAIVFDFEGSSYVHGDSGETVSLGTEMQATQLGLAALPGGRWAQLDPGSGTFEIHGLDGRIAVTALPEEIPGDAYAKNVLLFVEHGVATVVVDTQAEDQGLERPTWLLAFDTETGELLADLPYTIGLDTWPTSYRPLPDRRFVLSYDSGRLEVIAADGTVEATVTGAPGNATVQGDLTGARVARAGAEEIVVYDIGLTEVEARLSGFATPAGRIAFVADDRLLSYHFDGTALLWDLSTGALIGPLLELGTYFRFGFAVAEDGSSVIQATPHGIVRIPLDAESWVDGACALVDRPLTQEELDAVAPGRSPLDPCGFG